MLTLENVVARQGTFTLRADLSVPQGARVAIIGASGSGKSTLLNVISGFSPVQSGTLSIAQQDITSRAPGDRPLSIVFQDSNLFPHLTAEQNVGLGIRPSLRLSAAESDQVAAALADVGLDGYGARKPANLSGGQQSRLALARVLLRKRPVLLLDEPFAALGPALKTDMLTLVEQIAEREQLTVLMVTHDPSDARALAQHSIFVDDGMVHPPVETEALLADPPAALRDYLGLS